MKLLKPKKLPEGMVVGKPTVSHKSFIVILVVVVVVAIGLLIWVRNLDNTPKPGQQVGPPPTSQEVEDDTPTGTIQILPSGDSDSPSSEDKPASGG